MIKIVICDDEIHYQNKLEMELNEFAKDKYYLDIVKISTGIQMINYFKKENDIDIIFLDVHMPNIDGMEVAKELRKIGYRDEIIFYTHSKPEVFEAFDVDAFHYIIKEETDKIRRESIYQKAIDEARKQKENFISVACAGKSKIIPLAKIMYFKVSKSIVYIYLEDGSVVDF
ncbi:MAG: response regulator, partial [Lachnospiraceae bacterium]|nr:response regulator [Lachnospiraceae bacterium]